MPTPRLKANRFGLPAFGLGLGLRSVHYAHVLEHQPAVGWFEAISENYLYTQGRPLYLLEQVAERYPVVLHGVSMSIGSTDPLDLDHLQRLKALAARISARWISDHLCWTGVNGRNTHDLLPLPLTETSLAHCITRVKQAQDILERPLMLENPSTYAAFTADTISEWEFLGRLCTATDCGLLLDVNNIYVSSRNHGFDPLTYLDAVPWDRVVQFHIAGHTDHGTHCVDTHIGPVVDAVWNLWAEASRRAPPTSACLEWDADIPEFPVVWAEAERAREFAARHSLPRMGKARP